MALLLEPDRHVAAAVKAACRISATVLDDLESVERAYADSEDRVVIIGTSSSPAWAEATVRWLRRRLTGATVVVLRDTPDESCDPRLLACGADAVIDLTAQHRSLGELLGTIRDGRARGGRIVAVVSAKGGVGKTVVAANLAVALRAGGARRVCLVDLDLGFGDVATALGASAPAHHLGMWAGADGTDGGRDEDDAARVERIVTRHSLGLDYVAAPTGTGDAVRVPVQVVDGVLNTLPLHYDVVVVDTAARLSTHVVSALDCAHHQVVVSTPERPALRNLNDWLDGMSLLDYPDANRSIVLNRSAGRRALENGYIDGLLDVEVAAHVPYSEDVPVSLNRGVPLAADQPHHPVSTAIADLASQLLPAPVGLG